jgi:hypothetical protein
MSQPDLHPQITQINANTYQAILLNQYDEQVFPPLLGSPVQYFFVDNPIFTWSINGITLQTGTSSTFITDVK